MFNIVLPTSTETLCPNCTSSSCQLSQQLLRNIGQKKPLTYSSVPPTSVVPDARILDVAYYYRDTDLKTPYEINTWNFKLGTYSQQIIVDN